MPVYLLIDVQEVRDPQGYAEYIRQVPAVVAKFGGKYLARGGKTRVLSGDWDPGRVIVLEFPSRERLEAWWSSPEYRKIAPLRENSARVNAVAVEGI